MRRFLFLVLFFLMRQGTSKAETYEEILHLTPLPNGDLLYTFELLNISAKFNLTSHQASQDLYSSSLDWSHLFPLSISHLVTAYDVSRFDLSLTQGSWDASTWGSPVRAFPAACNANPSGAQLFAAFRPPAHHPAWNADDIWIKFVSSVGSLFCASLPVMSQTNSIKPTMYFDDLLRNLGNVDWRFTVLAREIVCTENLSPWLSLLPTKGKVGLLGLVDPLKLYRAAYHSMSVNYELKVVEGRQQQHVLRQYLSSVIPKFMLKELSLQSIFGRKVPSLFPLATSTKILVSSSYLPLTLKNFKQSPLPINDHLFAYENEQCLEDIRLVNATSSPIPFVSTIAVSRYLLGSSLDNGQIKIQIRNSSPTSSAVVKYLDMYPWQMRVFMSSLSLTLETLSTSGQILASEKLSSPISFFSKLIYSPCLDRQRPSMIEFEATLGPQMQATLSFDFRKKHINVNEYPMDPNRGLDLPAALLKASIDHETVQLMTNTLLLTLPVPDFSMPFNVIALTSTVVAILYSSIFNIVYQQTFSQ